MLSAWDFQSLAKLTPFSWPHNLRLSYPSYHGAMSRRQPSDVSSMTLRFRLTFWYTLLLAVVLLLFAVGFQAVVARALYGEVDDMIQSQAERVVAVFEANIDPMRSRLPIPAIVFASQVFAQASTLQGTVIDKSPGMGDQMMPLPEEMRERNLAGESGFYTWQGDGVTLRVFSTPVHSPEGQVVATVQVARSLDTIDSMLKIARLALLQ